ncbi:MAG: flagellar export chaperone FlgN [Planctomycetes bacterium]|nr:flagellar export chaperone FlgN [Planctomycetota bacterium]
MNEHDTDALAELVARKLRVVTQLRELTVRQPALIDSDDMKTLLRVLSAKQRLLEEVQRLDARLERFRRQDPEARVWRSPEDRRRCRAAAEQCQRLVEEVKALEAKDKDALVRRRSAVSQELDHAQAAAEARNAYQPVASPVRLDLSSES